MNVPTVNTYATLLKKVRSTLLEGQQKIEAEKVKTYWLTGKYILDHLTHHTHKETYGREVVLKLAKDLGTDESVIRRCREFAAAFPDLKIRAGGHGSSSLSWSHYRALLTVSDEHERLRLAERAGKEHWIAKDLEVEIRNLHWHERAESENAEIPKLPVPTLGPFWTYKIVAPEFVHDNESGQFIDLGFSAKIKADLFADQSFAPGTIISSEKNKKSYTLSAYPSSDEINKISRSCTCAKGAQVLTPDFLYTYKTYIKSIYDADTFHVEIDVGFSVSRSEPLRLKWIDAPELNTPEGKAAKKFAENELKDVSFIIIKSTKTEKWRRYLADVFFSPASAGSSSKGQGSRNAKQGTNPDPKTLDPKTLEYYGNALIDHPIHGKLVYLNQLLLNKGHAVRVRYG